MYIFIGAAIVAALLFLASYFVMTIPVFVIARKAGYRKAWLAWIPGLQSLVLMDLKHGAPIQLLPNWTLRDRFTTGLLYCIGKVVAPFVLLFIPVVNVITLFLPVVPAAACYVEFLINREVLDRYAKDDKGNRTKALIIAIADVLFGGLIRGMVLLVLMNKEPLPQPVYSED